MNWATETYENKFIHRNKAKDVITGEELIRTYELKETLESNGMKHTIEC